MRKLDHIAIFVDELDAGIAFYRGLLGGEPVIAVVPELGITCAFFVAGDGPAIELVTFSGKGELNHGDVVIAIEVVDLDRAIGEYRALGMKVYDQVPTENLPLRRGWITKKGGHGTIIELCQAGEIARFIESKRAGTHA
ncbi:VOC family protein [Tsuneonella sp. CC-YZS046]|uniref:VOC family protein n=1 Tax=Tsuneonella sp. CC-YZS046 TaxID=3042152 RepID=UPI002D76AC79|nr:VOC family protein [Tsuneonella sp. CC-YZS046]WRO65333.1 VOC family protein [Tsuneonella sp. CC-YZS046]